MITLVYKQPQDVTQATQTRYMASEDRSPACFRACMLLVGSPWRRAKHLPTTCSLPFLSGLGKRWYEKAHGSKWRHRDCKTDSTWEKSISVTVSSIRLGQGGTKANTKTGFLTSCARGNFGLYFPCCMHSTSELFCILQEGIHYGLRSIRRSWYLFSICTKL